MAQAMEFVCLSQTTGLGMEFGEDKDAGSVIVLGLQMTMS
jgi:hypothetical protein